MSDATIERSYIETYNDSLILLSQQRPSRFRNFVMSSAQKGEGAAPVEQVAAAQAQEVTTRGQVKPIIETVHDRRWEYPKHFVWGDLCDEIDKLKINIELSGAYTQTGIASVNREIDDEVIDSLLRDAQTGRSGGTTTSLPSGNVIAVDEGAAAATGMNTDKLLAAREIILGNNVDLDDPNNMLCCGISAAQERDLIEQVKVVNKDYQDSAVLAGNGTSLKSWFGINFVLTERLNVDGSSYRRNPFWCKSGVHLGIWNDVSGDISKRPDLNLNPMHITVNASFGGTRTEEEKVCEILCSEA
jgi:hypothetical protein